jgi:hypothetical protein
MFEDTIGLPVMTGAHADVLRCYLAVSDLAACQSRGAWLSVDNRIESSRTWLATHACVATGLERAAIAAEAHAIAQDIAQDIAQEIAHAGFVNEGPESGPPLFTAQMTLNFASPLVARVWRKCIDVTRPAETV